MPFPIITDRFLGFKIVHAQTFYFMFSLFWALQNGCIHNQNIESQSMYHMYGMYLLLRVIFHAARHKMNTQKLNSKSDRKSIN